MLKMPLLLALALTFPLLAATCESNRSAPPAVENGAAGPTAADGEIIQRRVESEEATFRIVRVQSGLTNPWGLEFLSDGRMLVTERAGRMSIVEGGQSTEITGLPDVNEHGQGGLLDVRLHPDYDTNGWVYFTFSHQDDGGYGTAIARGRLDGNTMVDVEIIYSMPNKTNTRQHFGSRITFMNDGTVLFTIGDRGQGDRAQDLMDPAGSTIRINDDGSIPQDNPFIGRSDALPELYTAGNRNSQGMDIHPQTGVVWQTEHGPRGGDELNRIVPGANYGWPVVSEGADYRTRQPIGASHEDRPEFEAPTLVWTPSIATSGTHFYTGDAFPAWQNNLFVGGLAMEQVRRIVLDGDQVTHQETLLEGAIGRIRDIRQGPDGFLYLLTDEGDGGIYRLEPVE
ncbi:PQQ-dependent sugar dehydrogenase [soil metagenome]